MEVAKEKMLSKLMAEMDREQKAEYREKLEKVRAQIAVEVEAQPEYQALASLSDGVLEDGSPSETVPSGARGEVREERVQQLARGKNLVHTTSGGMDAEAAAVLLGFESGDALVDALTNLEDP